MLPRLASHMDGRQADQASRQASRPCGKQPGSNISRRKAGKHRSNAVTSFVTLLRIQLVTLLCIQFFATLRPGLSNYWLHCRLWQDKHVYA